MSRKESTNTDPRKSWLLEIRRNMEENDLYAFMLLFLVHFSENIINASKPRYSKLLVLASAYISNFMLPAFLNKMNSDAKAVNPTKHKSP